MNISNTYPRVTFQVIPIKLFNTSYIYPKITLKDLYTNVSNAPIPIYTVNNIQGNMYEIVISQVQIPNVDITLTNGDIFSVSVAQANKLQLQNYNYLTQLSAPPIPVPGFNFTLLENTLPTDVQFTDTSTNHTDFWVWKVTNPDNSIVNFGYGPTPIYTFNLAGTYSVTLTTGNASGQVSITQSVSVPFHNLFLHPINDLSGVLPNNTTNTIAIIETNPFTTSFTLSGTFANEAIVTVTSSDQRVMPNGNISVSGNIITLQPPALTIGSATITVNATHGEDSISTTFDITIGVNVNYLDPVCNTWAEFLNTVYIGGFGSGLQPLLPPTPLNVQMIKEFSNYATNLTHTAVSGTGNYIQGLNLYTNASYNVSNYTMVTPVRDTNCWINNLDISCLAIWNSISNSPVHAGVLITPQHLIVAEHFGINGPNVTVSFLGNDGNVYTGTIVNAGYVYQNDPPNYNNVDVIIYTLGSPMPSEVTFAQILPTDVYNYTRPDGYDYFNYIGTGVFNQKTNSWTVETATYGFFVNQFRQAVPCAIQQLDIKTIPPSGEVLSNFGVGHATTQVYGIDEDSCSPVFVILDGKLQLLNVLTGAGNESYNLPNIGEVVNGASQTDLIPSWNSYLASDPYNINGYRVTSPDLSSYPMIY